jgi:hypothetical protein
MASTFDDYVNMLQQQAESILQAFGKFEPPKVDLGPAFDAALKNMQIVMAQTESALKRFEESARAFESTWRKSLES